MYLKKKRKTFIKGVDKSKLQTSHVGNPREILGRAEMFSHRADNGGFPAGTLARYYPGIEDGCVTTGVLRQGGHETHGETDPLGSEILNGNDYSKLLLLGLGVPNSHSVGLLKPVHPFVQPLIPPPESTLQIFIVSTLFQARLGPWTPPFLPSTHGCSLDIYIYIYAHIYIYT